MTILEEADATINGPRRAAYGPAEESFARIATVWSALLRQPITATQVALCMAAFKLCREANAHSRDNLVDLCGYAALLQAIEEAPKP